MEYSALEVEDQLTALSHHQHVSERLHRRHFAVPRVVGHARIRFHLDPPH